MLVWSDEQQVPLTAAEVNATLPFVIPSEAEGSAVQRTSRGNVFRQTVA
jgi:hypothetical protein